MKRLAILLMAFVVAATVVGCKEEKNTAPITDRKTDDAAKF
jgi:hypothetical protein